MSYISMSVYVCEAHDYSIDHTVLHIHSNRLMFILTIFFFVFKCYLILFQKLIQVHVHVLARDQFHVRRLAQFHDHVLAAVAKAKVVGKEFISFYSVY